MKNIKYFKSLSVIINSILISILICSCENELDFEYHEIDPVVVIEGSLTDHGATVSLTLTTPMNETMNTEKLTDASVKITDITDGNVSILTVDEAGVFRDYEGGISGHSYRLDVSIGDNLYSSVTRMQSPVEIEDIQFHWVRMPGDDMAVLSIVFSDNPQTLDHYWIRLYRNGQPYAMNTITDLAQINGLLEETFTTTHRDESKENDEKQLLKEGDVLTVTVTPVDTAMFDYLVALGNNSNGRPQFFPEFCLGYFLASPVSSKSIVYLPAEIDYAQ